MRRISSFSSLALPLAGLLALAGCDDANTDDAGIDAGASGDAGRDSGPPRADSGPRDSGPSDPCASDDATATVGCNGGIPGAAADNAFGGRCTPGDDTAPEGSCTDTGAICYAFDPEGNDSPMGICIVGCTAGATYTSTSDCPTGSRCFDFGGGLCFADCNSGTDCSTMSCDGDNSCVGEVGVATDGGVPMDAGTAGDAGTGDAGTGDAGIDAGPS